MHVYYVVVGIYFNALFTFLFAVSLHVPPITALCHTKNVKRLKLFVIQTYYFVCKSK